MSVGRYVPLLQYLAALAPEQHAVTLSFAALEALVDGPLPRTARTVASYWTSGDVARVNWDRDGWTAQLNRSVEAVTFSRESAMSARYAGDTKYTPLLRHLQALPADQDTVTLTFAAIEVIIGAALPPGAWTIGFWSGYAPVARFLRRAGWRMSLTGGHDAARFFRQPAAVLRTPRLDYGAIIAAYEAGERVAAIAQRLGLTSASVYYALHRAGIPLRGRR